MYQLDLLRATFRFVRLLPLLLLLLGCPAAGDDDDDATEEPQVVLWPQTLGVDSGRFAPIQGPEGWDQTEALPLVILLHGYGATAELQDYLFRFASQVEDRRFLLVLPDGTEDADGSNFWNATDACCDWAGTGVDDSAWLRGLVDEALGKFNISNVAFSGHSNGHFMSYRMACDHSEVVDAIAGLAGATWLDDSMCEATDPVAVLHVHGDADDVIEYEGDGVFPSAPVSVQTWADRAGCTGSTEGDRLDLIDGIDGAETRTEVFAGCASDTALWTMEGGAHIPLVNSNFGDGLLDFLLTER